MELSCRLGRVESLEDLEHLSLRQGETNEAVGVGDEIRLRTMPTNLRNTQANSAAVSSF